MKNFNSNLLAEKWIPYVRDKDEEIRTNFSEAISFILNNRINSSLSNKSFHDDIPADLEEFVRMITDSLVAVLTEVLESSNQSLHETLILTAKSAAW